MRRLWERIRFCVTAVRSEFKHNFRIGFFISVALNCVTFVGMFSPIRLGLPDWSWSTWFILFLAALILLLFFVFEGIYRFHTQTVQDYVDTRKILGEVHQRELKAEDEYHQLATSFQHLIGEGKAFYLTFDNSSAPQPKNRLNNWQADVLSSVAILLGNETAGEFLTGLPDKMDTVDEQKTWLLERTRKLMVLCEGQTEKHFAVRSGTLPTAK